MYKRQNAELTLLLLPYLIPFFLFVIYPLIQAINYSFYRFNIRTFDYIGLKNYIDVFRDDLFSKSVITTFQFVFGIVPLIIILSIILSFMLIKIKGKLRTLFMGIFYLPEVTAVITLTLSWKLLYDDRYGMVNWLMEKLGFESVSMLGNTNTVIPALIIMIVVSSLGRPIILYIAAMSSIPKTLYEAAMIDGATEWQMLWKITFPLIMPTTLYIMIIYTINVFQIYTIIHLMTGGGVFYRTTTMAYMMVMEAFVKSNYGKASAIGVIFLVIIAGFAVIQYKYFNKEIEY